MQHFANASRLRHGATLAAFTTAIAACLGAIVYNAWVCDDAYITVRAIDNCARGFGLTWNPGERVQVFTHPLWAILLLAAHRITTDFYYTTVGLGILLAALAVLVLAFRVAPTPRAACLAVAALAASRAFTDYSTSGLENSLTHALLALFAAVYLGPSDHTQTRRLGMLTGLLLVNRLDAGLLVLPAMASLFASGPRLRTLKAVAVGLLPLALWEVFAFFYYGTWVPNTALAKLATGLGPVQLVPRGLQYLANSLLLDPLTLVVTGCGIALPILRRDRKAILLGAGAALALLYVVWIGGDFMSGRFLTAPFFLAVVALARSAPSSRFTWPLVALLLSMIVVPSTSPFKTRQYANRWDAAIDAHGIADERAYYGRWSHLRSSWGQSPWPAPRVASEAVWLREHWNHDPFVRESHAARVLNPAWPPPDDRAAQFRPLVVRGQVGFLGYYLGPDVHVLDYHALADPLLARLPAVVPDPLLRIVLPRLHGLGWRAGHLTRRIPEGYPETLATGVNHLSDPELAAYWDRLVLVTRGPLFDRARLRALVTLGPAPIPEADP